MQCSGESATYDTFSNLSLELPESNIESCHISECFNNFFHGEVVKGWNCPNCKVPRDAIKKLDISKLPPVLVIHLKRFHADPYNSSSFRKKTIHVDFPLTDMNMMPYIARSEKSNGSNSKHIYSLYGVSNHYGTMGSGHYTGENMTMQREKSRYLCVTSLLTFLLTPAFCKNYMQDRWYKFDDHTVSPLDRADVKSSAAYILFYTIKDEEKRRRY